MSDESNELNPTDQVERIISLLAEFHDRLIETPNVYKKETFWDISNATAFLMKYKELIIDSIPRKISNENK